jgi:uroporphyrinogen decarboxylase
VVDGAVDAVLDDARGLPGHVFNLGHGVLPSTDPDALARVVDRVHAATAR